MTRKRTTPLPSIGDSMEAIKDLANKYNLLLSGVTAALSIIDRMDEKERPRAALIALDQLRPQIQKDE